MNLTLSSLSLGVETVAVVPLAALSWHRVQLPAGSLARKVLKDRGTPRLRAVLEGLLEDQLLDDPAQLHFALQPGARDGTPVWVAVCNRQWLAGAAESLQQAGTAMQRLVPEWAPKDEALVGPSTLWVIGTPETATAVWTDATGVHHIPVQGQQDLHPALQGKEFARVVAEPAVATLAEQMLRREVQVQTPAERWHETSNDWDLAQFDLARRNPWLQRLQHAATTLWHAPQWKPVRWTALVLLLVQVIGLNAFAWHAKSQLEQQRRDIRTALVSTFPHVTVVVDAPLQMERELAALRQSSGNVTSKDMEFLLTGFGSIDHKTLAALAPKAIDFVAGELRLGGMAINPEQLETLSGRWGAAGLAARVDGDTLVLQTRSAP
jgi:general secretion pathway protein L